ncbi:DUF4136 domain-containing protein [Phenylobacterium sp.]|uniref:DUF4136 domain-containing protein n=1 Tax=Phenylobacterium sp. TaxID=1871053 RepID=UPI002EDAE37D
MPKYLINSAAALGLAVAFAGAAAEAGPAGKVVVMESAAATIAPGSTWAWAPFTTSSPDPRVANDIVQERTTRAVEASMASHGLRRSSRADARYLVTYHVAVANKVKVDSTPNSGSVCGFRGCVRGYGSAIDIKQYAEGTLVIDIIERDTGRLVWRAASKKKVTEKDITQAKINAVVADMTKTLPKA